MRDADRVEAGGDPGVNDDPPDEFQAIARWVRLLPVAGPGVLVGPGDDCAVLRVGDDLAISTDTLVLGVHASWNTFSPEDVGWKAMAAALSDLAATRAVPLAAVVSLSASPQDGPKRDGVMAGLAACARAHGCPVVGGDTTSTSGPLTLTVTVLGRAAPPLLRSGARPGDLLLLSGPLGWAAAGLRGLGGDRAARAQRRPRPRLDLVDTLRTASAAIDISDGLLADAAHLARASAVSLELDPAALVGRDLRAAAGDEAAALALTGGEDYELLVTAPSALPGLRVVGRVLKARDHDLVRPDGSAFAHDGRGWVHGASAPTEVAS